MCGFEGKLHNLEVFPASKALISLVFFLRFLCHEVSILFGESGSTVLFFPCRFQFNWDCFTVTYHHYHFTGMFLLKLGLLFSKYLCTILIAIFFNSWYSFTDTVLEITFCSRCDLVWLFVEVITLTDTLSLNASVELDARVICCRLHYFLTFHSRSPGLQR